MITIGVFFGARSVEHEVSIITAIQTMETLREEFNIVPIYINKNGDFYTGENLFNIDNFKNLKKIMSESQKVNIINEGGDVILIRSPLSRLKPNKLFTIDIAFPIIHGSYGEDGTLQGFFEQLKIPYVGSSVLASATTMDKIVTKLILKSSGINVVDGVWFSSDEWINFEKKCIERIENSLKYPLIIKPSDIGSSIGVKVVNSRIELIDAVNFVKKFSSRILAEKFIENMRELNISVLGDSEGAIFSVIEEPISEDEFLTFEDKYTSSGSGTKGMSSAKRIIPAEIDENMKLKIEKMALKAFYTLDLSGLCRIDFIIDTKENKIYINEFNTIPGSLAFYLWEASGWNFKDILKELVKLSTKKYRKEDMLIRVNKSNILSSVKLGVKK